eukprot:TRINITY_DN2598_c0_g2_i8.p1 TRINITY_DN2598_c0_g2~~TRINITY_DN2598_c0_g2_i8.p1  ORF type:complete len:131 (-),score=33.06 TRINITY_DN2598_c0_g2_i8:380-772(-)
MVMKEKMKGGIVITSSHNPVEWNGSSLLGFSATELYQDSNLSTPVVSFSVQQTVPVRVPFQILFFFTFPELFELSDGMLKFPTSLEICSVTEYSSAIDDHVNAILSLPEVKLDLVVGRKYKVCLDTVNGM